jgi:hypothetical protein
MRGRRVRRRWGAITVVMAMIGMALVLRGMGSVAAGYTPGPAPASLPVGYYALYGVHGVFIGVGSTINGLVGAEDGTLSPNGVYNADGKAIYLNGSAGIVGDARSGGNVGLANGVQITGTLIRPASTALTMGAGSGVGSDDTYDTVSFPGLPAATALTCPTGGTGYSGPNGQSLTLTPGTYGSLDYGGAFSLTLNGAGDYYFDSIATGNGATITAGAGTRVFVCGNAQFGGLDTLVPGDFYFEAQGSDGHNALKAGGGSDLVGHYFVPKGGIHLGSGGSPASFTGTLHALFVDIEHGVDGNGPSIPEYGSITVVKDAVGVHAAAAEFDFTTAHLTPTEFSLWDDGELAFPDLLPGSYTVHETAQTGWTLTGVTCQGAAASTVTPDGDGVVIDLAGGEDLVCTFTNTEKGRIVVDKVTDPAGSLQQFEFDPSWAANFFLADGDAPRDSGLLEAGDYSLAEIDLPADWILTGASCTVTDPVSGAPDPKAARLAPGEMEGAAMDPAAITLGPGETVTCIFENFHPGQPQKASLVIIKEADPADDTVFWFDGGDLPDFSLQDPSGFTKQFSDLDAGQYTITELSLGLDETWQSQGVDCDALDWSASGSAVTVNLSLGEVAVCTFSNAQMGRIVVDKVTDPASSAQEFEFDPSWSGIAFYLADGTEPHDSGLLPPGGYAVAEIDLPGEWILTGASCVVQGATTGAPMDPSQIVLGPGEIVVCTFENYDASEEVGASLTIIKEADPADDTVFSFDGGDLPDFTLHDPSDSSEHFADLQPGAYTITELDTGLDETWVFDGVECDALDWSANGTAVTVNLGEGEAAVCTFRNIQKGRIQVDKVTDPAGSALEFEFDPSWAANFFLADADEPYDSGLLVPGDYAVAEVNLPEDWILTAASCEVEGAVAGIPMDPEHITLGPGETVVCTFEDFDTGQLGQKASLVIVKQADPADDTVFSFDGGSLPDFTLQDPSDFTQLFANLDPGSYTIAELGLGLDDTWVFEGVECDALDWSADGAAVTVNLGEGEVAVCTFRNVEKGRVVVDKVTDPAGSPIEFGFEGFFGWNFWLTDEDDPYVTPLLYPGVYSLVEVDMPEAWILTDASCVVEGATHGATMDPAAISVGPGETVVCTFENFDTSQLEPKPSLTIIKDARPADDTVFWFDGGSLPDFSLQDPSNFSKVFPDLEPGTYTITELSLGLDDSWQFEKVECDGLDWSADGATVTVNLSMGEVVACTFHNAGELPYTGASPWVLPVGVAGLAALALGLGLVLLWWRPRPTWK